MRTPRGGYPAAAGPSWRWPGISLAVLGALISGVLLVVLPVGAGGPASPAGPSVSTGPTGPADPIEPAAAAPPETSPATSATAGGRGGTVTGAIPGRTGAGAVPPVVGHGPRTGNRVALTFDADLTESMLGDLRTGRVASFANLAVIDLLERQRVPATFFLTGMWVEQYPRLTARLAADPRFELANHTYAHAAFTADCFGLPGLPVDRLAEDVSRTFRIIEPYGGRQTRYFRFPGLCHDGGALAALAPLGVTVVDGDVVSGDPFASDWRSIVDAVLAGVQPGSVVIMHITEANAPSTDEALPHILAGLAERGLAPAPLSEVLAAP